MRPPSLRLLLTAGAVLGAVLGGLLLRGREASLRIVWPALAGDGALVLAPDGTSVLIDGGADAAAVVSWLGRELPFGRRRIDLVVLTRADSSTLPGQLAALRRYEIGAALYPGAEEPGADLLAWQQLAVERSAVARLMQPGDTYTAGACSVATPALSKQRAAVLLRCGDTAAWFLQSIDDALERELQTMAPVPAALLVWPWLRRTDGAFASSTSPTALLFAEGEGDDVLSWNARRIGAAQLLHEQRHGRVELVISNGVTIRTERAAE
jgi:hypothetical protein